MNGLPHHRLGALQLLACLMFVGCVGWAPMAWATCSMAPANQPVKLPFPATITFSGGSGYVGSQVQTTINFTCTNEPATDFKTMVQQAIVGQGTGYIVFNTNLANFQLHVGTSTPVSLNGQIATVGTVTTSGGSPGKTTSTIITGQLYKVNSGGGGTLHIGSGVDVTGPFYYQSGSGPSTSFPNTQVQGLVLSTAASTCTVNSPSDLTVILPTISTTALAASVGAIAGVTPFNLSYTCSVGAKIVPTMFSAMASATVGVINPSAGNATSVGLRVMNSSLTGGVNLFGANQASVTSTGGLQLLPYYVEYYRTSGGAISPGPVTGTVSYTLTYQ